MDNTSELDEHGHELLARLADDRTDPCWRQFDALYYELVWRYLRSRHQVLAVRVSRYLGVDASNAPQVLEGEADEVAHEATKIALRRVRNNANRFDARRGPLTSWVIGAAEYAWIDVARAIVSARRSERLIFTDPQELHEAADAGQTTEEHVLRRLQDEVTLEEAADLLSPREFAAIRLVCTLDYSYADAAACIFGDAAKTKAVDGLLTRGKAKLAQAWDERRPAPSNAHSAKFAQDAADEGAK